jgi:hypothetical protein
MKKKNKLNRDPLFDVVATAIKDGRIQDAKELIFKFGASLLEDQPKAIRRKFYDSYK